MLARNLVNAVVALAAVLGLRTAEMLGTHSLIIHGPRASRPANVCHGEGFLLYTYVIGMMVDIVSLKSIALLTSIHGILTNNP